MRKRGALILAGIFGSLVGGIAGCFWVVNPVEHILILFALILIATMSVLCGSRLMKVLQGSWHLTAQAMLVFGFLCMALLSTVVGGYTCAAEIAGRQLRSAISMLYIGVTKDKVPSLCARYLVAQNECRWVFRSFPRGTKRWFLVEEAYVDFDENGVVTSVAHYLPSD